MIFFGIDGDRIGARIEAFIITGEVKEAAAFSGRVSLALEQMMALIHAWGGRVLFSGGDSLLAESDKPLAKQQYEELTRLFLHLTGCTASVGIGESPVEAYLALRLGKVTGSGRVVHYAEDQLGNGSTDLNIKHSPMDQHDGSTAGSGFDCDDS